MSDLPNEPRHAAMNERQRAALGGLRVARTNYTVRTASFAYSFLVIGLVLLERKMGPLAWSLLALQFLVYPQLAYLHASTAQDARAAEIRNLYADSITLGAWVAMLGFPTWIAYAALFSTTLNTAIVRGWIGAACATICFAGGALAWVAPMGFMHYPGTSDLVGMVDRDGRWRYSSPSYGRLLAAEDLVPGADAFRRLHEEDQFRVRAALQELVRSGLSCKLRMRLLTRNGDVRNIESLVHAVRAEDESITGAVIASRDITELADRDEQLEVAGLALERMAEAMLIINAAGRILTINKAFTRITGHEPADVLGQPESRFRSVMQPDAFYEDMYATVLRSGQWRGSTWCQRPDGTVYREWRSVSAVRDADARVTHYVVLFGELNRHGGVGEEWPPKSA